MWCSGSAFCNILSDVSLEPSRRHGGHRLAVVPGQGPPVADVQTGAGLQVAAVILPHSFQIQGQVWCHFDQKLCVLLGQYDRPIICGWTLKLI